MKKGFQWAVAGALVASIISPTAALAAKKPVSLPQYNWTAQASAGSKVWCGVTVANDGRQMAAVECGGYVYTSDDAGKTWTRVTKGLPTFNVYWASIAMSANGKDLAIASAGEYIYTSNDAGATWKKQAGSGQHNWVSVAISKNGKRIIAAAYNQYLYTSANGGKTWTQGPAGSWMGVTSSADGMNVAAQDSGGYVYTSTDGGATWINRTGVPFNYYYRMSNISSSADGMTLAVAASQNSNGGPDYIYVSHDGGATWSVATAAGAHIWNAISVSDDATTVAAVSSDGAVVTSTDSGTTWVVQQPIENRFWRSVALSKNGKVLVATEDGTDVFNPSAGNIWTAVFK